MKKIVLGILVVIFIATVCINIFLLSKHKECSYEIKTDYYTENINVNIYRFSNTSINKEYIFTNEDVLEKEKELLKDDDYLVETSDLTIKATKNIKKKKYYDTIKEYEELGFVCK